MEESSALALSRVALCAERQGFGVVRLEDGLAMSMKIELSDGRKIQYQILLSADGHKIRASENPAFEKRLPCFCPERHINSDGTFCLYWEGHEAINVTDASTAQHWLDTLIKFLMTQERASKSKRWHGGGWAHGSAAFYQQRAYKAASELGQNFLTELDEKRIHVVKRPGQGMHGNGPLLRLYRDGALAYTVWIRSERVVGLRQKCFCSSKRKGRKKQLRSCGDHARMASELAIAMWKWEEAEAIFWRSLTHKECCQTMKECPLRELKKESCPT